MFCPKLTNPNYLLPDQTEVATLKRTVEEHEFEISKKSKVDRLNYCIGVLRDNKYLT